MSMFIVRVLSSLLLVEWSSLVAHNGLQLQEVGDFEAQNCLPPQNLIRSTKLHLTTEPPISCRCCYRLAFFSVCSYLLICPARKVKSIKVKNKFTGIEKWSPSATKPTKQSKFIKSQKPKNISHKIVALL